MGVIGLDRSDEMLETGSLLFGHATRNRTLRFVLFVVAAGLFRKCNLSTWADDPILRKIREARGPIHLTTVFGSV